MARLGKPKPTRHERVCVGALTREDLDLTRCDNPACPVDHSGPGAPTSIMLQQGCHPNDGVTVEYRRDLGTLRMRCNTCEEPVAEIIVARHHDAGMTH